MSNGISFHVETSAWERTLNFLARKLTNKFQAAVYTASSELLEKIKEYTPIGNPNLWHPPYWPKNYVPGTLKASWEMSTEGNTITILNKQPYAYRVEYGQWSTQAPEGMMRRAVME